MDRAERVRRHDRRRAGGRLGSALTDRPTIADGESTTRTVVVPARADRLDVSTGRPSDTGADLDLVVTGPGGVVRQSADGDSEEAVSSADPAAGTCTVTVEGYGVPAGTTTYDHVDVCTSATLGTLSVTSPSTSLSSGEASEVTGSHTAGSAVAGGRRLTGTMRFTSDGGALLGTGSVTVGTVTP